MISWIALNMVEGLKPSHRAALLREFGSPENVLRAGEMELSAIPEIKPEMAYAIAHISMRAAEDEKKKAGVAGIHILCPSDSGYPELLRRIPDPPLALYVRGELRADELTLALVGSRKPTPYGLNAVGF